MVRLLIDCDTGIDDALMLLYLAGSTEAEIIAVGSVHGNIPARLAAENTLRVLDVVGKRDIPVAVGAARPMAQPLQTAELVHGKDGLGNTNQPPPSRPVVDESAVEQMVRLARAHPGELTLLATGPFTNLGCALLVEPDLPTLIPRVVVMGGAVAAPGNATATAEANIWHDPEAAELVCAAGWDLTMVPLDATHQAILQGDDLTRLSNAGSATARFAWSILQHYLSLYETFLGFRGCVLHDPLAAALALDPSLARYDQIPVRVELRGAETRGMTVADRRAFRESVGDQRAAVSVAMEIDRERFLALFLQRLGA